MATINNQNRSWTVCVLCRDGSGMGLRHYLFAAIIESFRHVMERHGYDVFFISNRVGKASLTDYGHCRYRRADGVFIVNTDYESPDARELIGSGLPKVAFDYADESIGCVTTDSDKSMDLLYGHLYGLGHRSVVYMHGEARFITQRRIAGLEKAMAARSEALHADQLIQSQYYSSQGGYASMKRALERAERPTAVIASDDYSAVGAIRAAREMGLGVPEDISVVGFDGIEIAELMTPRLTTVRQDTAGIGAKAAESLIKQILGVGPRGKPETIMLEPALLVGASTRRVGE